MSFGETSEQECDKSNSSPPTASQRGADTKTTAYLCGQKRKKKEQIERDQIQSVWRGCRSGIGSNRSDKSLNPSCAFALGETQSTTIHRKFINFLQSRGGAVDVNEPVS